MSTEIFSNGVSPFLAVRVPTFIQQTLKFKNLAGDVTAW